MKTRPSVVIAASLLLFAACKNKNAGQGTARQPAFDVSGIDATVKPGDNFFLYANGKWMKAAKIPDDQSGWGSFYTLYQDNLKQLHTLLEEAGASGAEKGTTEQKVGDYYASGMDTLAIEKAGLKPIQPLLAKVDAVSDYKQFMNLVHEGYTTGNGDLMGFYVFADEKNSRMNIPVFTQTGLSLPEKDYYTKGDSASVAARNAMIRYASKLFVLAGQDTATAAKNAQAVLALETEIAKSHRSPVELRNPQLNYNKMAVSDLHKQQPNINWTGFFNTIGAKPDSVNVGQPDYFAALNNMLPGKPIELWKTKLKYDYLRNSAGLLPKSFRDASFAFKQTFSGQKVQEDRWKTIVNAADQEMGELLGQLYVKKHFTEDAKKRMDELVSNLQKAFAARIQKLDWMSDSTKQRANAKLNTFLKKIGYPEKWKNYDDVTIDRNSFYANGKALAVHGQKEMIGKIGKPVDRSEWMMSPPTVNAYYNPTNNEIVFPAGILQYPFFNPNADDAINYGGIGMVIGHEMTHGFDDQGSQYDAAGNLQNWWTKEDNERFKAKTAAVVKQYNGYTVFDSLHVKGELTLGENIADIGGLAIAWDAFQMTDQAKSKDKIDGFTPDQRFFLGFAQVWRLINRDETMRMRLNVDPHSPEMFRVNGPLANFDPFYTAFNVTEGDKLYIKPDQRARIW
ncbi:putative endopeptidase [Cnuella takakiae]|uniref:Putative endopeptidase n=1 Tax=Cnuella takakiae TaxID=1302690 RepID=A0A1M4ZXH8_9BACT|nr:M13 family metallopeptidase [Cnuella takakiae]OLY92174.1 peptidase M13 [Cnuella takakiae]SHF22557.1 putative endopeptidase [Cnuella takakiae]